MKRFVIMIIVLFSSCIGSTREPSEELTPETASVETKASGASPPDSADVELKNIKFSPGDVTVASGGTVVWTNRDRVVHTVTFREYPFDVILNKGKETNNSFDSPGIYDYFCSIHPGMRGKVRVE